MYVRPLIARIERAIGSRNAWSGSRAPLDPRAPEARGRVHPRLRLLDVCRRRQVLRPRQRAVRHARRRAACGGRARGRPRSRSPCRCDRRSVTPAPLASAVWRPSLQRPLGRGAPVVEDRLADELHLDAALDALDRPHQQVVAVVVGGRARVRRDGVLAACAGPSSARRARRPSRSACATSSRACWCRARTRARPGRRCRTARRGSSRPGGPAASRTRSASRTTARTASRSPPSGATSAAVWQFERKP